LHEICSTVYTGHEHSLILQVLRIKLIRFIWTVEIQEAVRL
jgi:hypothetical protein